MEESQKDLDRSIEKIHRVFENYLKTNHMRKTPERFAILDAIYLSEGIFTIEQIYSHVVNIKKFHISLSTTYNTFELLEKAHLIVRHQAEWKGDPRLMHYDRSFNQNIQHHFICKECGNTFEFADKSLMGAIARIKKAGFRPEAYSLFVYGTCARCHARKQKQLKIKSKK